MKFDIYIQDNLVLSGVEAQNTGTALGIVAEKLESGEVSFDETKPQSIKVVPVS